MRFRCRQSARALADLIRICKAMGYLLTVAVFLAVFLLAPLKGALLFCGAILLAALIVQATTSAIAKVNVSLTDSFKAIVLSVFLAAVAAFTIVSFLIGAPLQLITSSGGLALVALQYCFYVLGFRIALGLTFAHAATVAIVSTLLTSISIWYVAKMMSSA